MFKSKHSGWTWELKRTPFGNGGNPFSGVTDALASIDPGPAIGSAGASIDKAVNDNIPGGWITVGALAAGGLAIAYAPEIMAYAAEMGIEPAAASAQLGIPGVDAATGATVPLATSTAGADAILAAPDVAVNLGATGGGTVGSLNAALPAAGAPVGTSIGMSGALAPGTVMGTGAAGGGAIGSTYAVGANGLPATDFLGNYIPASSINTGGVPNTITGTPSSISLSDVNNAKNLAKALTSTAGNQLTGAAQNLATGQTGVGSAIPALIRGNQNPFLQTAQQPIRDAQPMDLSSLANLLKQG